MKVVINRCFGGFGLSQEALNELGKVDDEYYESDYSRKDPLLVSVVEKLGDKANGSFAKLKVVDIPCGIDYKIDVYDGMETIHEIHRSWR